MTPLFLSAEDVEHLTGHRQASRQLEWLRKHGLRCWLNGKGRVVVPVAAIEGRRQAPVRVPMDFSGA